MTARSRDLSGIYELAALCHWKPDYHGGRIALQMIAKSQFVSR
jgi:hypothetical protein